MLPLESFARNFYEYVRDIFPYFLLATFISALIQVYVNLSWIKRFMKNSYLASVFTGAIGGLLPVCSCSMIPVSLMINSLSKSYAPVVSFLMVAPVVSPITVFLTYALFGVNVAIFRVVVTFIFALFTAYVVDKLFKKPSQIPLGAFSRGNVENKFKLFLNHFLGTFKLTGKYVLIGIAIAAFIKVVVPSTWVAYVSKTLLSYPLISILSIPIYVCSGEEVPIAKALVELGFTQGNALTFMLASSGICLPTITATLSFLPKGVVFLYVTSWFLLSTVIGLFYDYVIFNV